MNRGAAAKIWYFLKIKPQTFSGTTSKYNYEPENEHNMSPFISGEKKETYFPDLHGWLQGDLQGVCE